MRLSNVVEEHKYSDSRRKRKKLKGIHTRIMFTYATPENIDAIEDIICDDVQEGWEFSEAGPITIDGYDYETFRFGISDAMAIKGFKHQSIQMNIMETDTYGEVHVFYENVSNWKLPLTRIYREIGFGLRDHKLDNYLRSKFKLFFPQSTIGGR